MKIKTYKKSNPEDYEWIYNNSKMIYTFLSDAYKYLEGGFQSYDNHKNLRKNISEVKVVYTNDYKHILAIATYSDRFDGNKCTALAKSLIHPRAGKQAVVYLLTDEVIHYDKFYWCEVSHKVEKMIDKLGGCKIPVEYVPYVLGSTNKNVEIKPTGKNNYQYTRDIKNGDFTITKTMYGFSSYAVLENFKKDYFKDFETYLKNIKKLKLSDYDTDPILESMNNLDRMRYETDLAADSNIEFVKSILMKFYVMYEDEGVFEVTKFIKSEMRFYLNWFNDLYYKIKFQLHWGMREHYETMLEDFKQMYYNTTILKIHTFNP